MVWFITIIYSHCRRRVRLRCLRAGCGVKYWWPCLWLVMHILFGYHSLYLHAKRHLHEPPLRVVGSVYPNVWQPHVVGAAIGPGRQLYSCCVCNASGWAHVVVDAEVRTNAGYPTLLKFFKEPPGAIRHAWRAPCRCPSRWASRAATRAPRRFSSVAASALGAAICR